MREYGSRKKFIKVKWWKRWLRCGDDKKRIGDFNLGVELNSKKVIST